MDEQQKAVFFLGDAHLGSGPNQDLRRRTLLAFLAGLKHRATHLYVLGDLFDFWFEYRHAIPKGHFRILHALADLIDAGIETIYLGGNHDFWCGTYLNREVGLHVHQHPIVVRHQGRQIFLAHGDGIGPGDNGYRLLKAVLRHPVAIALYRTIHPDLGIPLAYCVSKTSRKHTKERQIILRNLSRHLVGPRFAAGEDAVLIGHIHDPNHLQDARKRDFLIVGDWIEHFTYARLANGTFTLERFQLSAEAQHLTPTAWPPGMEPACD
ncbi:MAG: UDP-2,3-diacylglucosamine diphosphatase [Candidatus Eisenbacteria sp.]|nr:UDP-2,3-diacylglucosamine diphosphatase [Candidatus Eisenbacteria bacterium]